MVAQAAEPETLTPGALRWVRHSNLTQASQNLYELINAQGITLYPDSAMRLAASRAVAVETPRGWRIGKQQQTHKIDLIVALAMAAFAAVRSQSESSYLADLSWVSDGDSQKAAERFAQARFQAHIHAGYYRSLTRRW